MSAADPRAALRERLATTRASLVEMLLRDRYCPISAIRQRHWDWHRWVGSSPPSCDSKVPIYRDLTATEEVTMKECNCAKSKS
jgi:hypothetical protein